MRRIAPVMPILTLLALSACSSGETETPEGASNADGAIEEASEDELAPTEQASSAATNVTTAPQQIEGIENRRVSFDPGANSATVEGSITGYEGVDYLLNVGSGQAMNISMATPNPSAYFNVLEPGETEVAIHVGSTSGNQFEGITAKSGDYRIRVYLMRSAARRDETASYRLEMVVD